MTRVAQILAFGIACTLASPILAQTSAPASDARFFGLLSGPLPQPQPFVLQSRPLSPTTYPNINRLPPARQDRVLTPREVEALAAALRASGGRGWRYRRPVQ